MFMARQLREEYSAGQHVKLKGVYIPPSEQSEYIPWKKCRALVWERDHGICQVCGYVLSQDGGAKFYQCGHIIDRAYGGSNRPSNLVVMCIICNQRKEFTKTHQEYIRWVKRYRKEIGISQCNVKRLPRKPS